MPYPSTRGPGIAKTAAQLANTSRPQLRPIDGQTPLMATSVTFGLSTRTQLAMTTSGGLPLRLPLSGPHGHKASTTSRWSSTRMAMTTVSVTPSPPIGLAPPAGKSHAAPLGLTGSSGSTLMINLVLMMGVRVVVVVSQMNTQRSSAKTWMCSRLRSTLSSSAKSLRDSEAR